MEKVVRIMMDLIASEVCGKTVDNEKYVCSDEELEKLYRLSKSHDLAHIVGNALIRNDLIADKELLEKFRKQIFLAVYRYEAINDELGRLRGILEGAGIPFISLKGAVIRTYYPEPWMRTSCDIDILVCREQLDKATGLLETELGYTDRVENYHDVSMMSPSGVHLELHHSIKENADNLDALLAECWSYADSAGGCEYAFSPEFFLFHQFSHAAYHFLHGGCGVRPFLDLYLLNRKLSFDRGALEGMLEKAGIKRFSGMAFRLADVWFGDVEHDELTKQMEQFVLSGGVYGTLENSVAVSQQKQKGRIGHILHRVWLPYELLCVSYPRLRGRRYLQPFYELVRWLRIFKPNTYRKKSRELEAVKNLSTEKKSEVNQMLQQLELL